MLRSESFKKGLLLLGYCFILAQFPYLLMAQESGSKKKWSEKLGFPKGKKVLILHMDDLGMCPEANSAGMNYIEKGEIMSGAVMMPCAAAENFVEWAKKHHAADIGVHLTLTSEWKTYRWPTLTDPAVVPGLIDPAGKMWPDVLPVVMHAKATEVDTEIRAQIQKMISLGLKPSHIDTHMGTLYGSYEFAKVFFKAAEDFQIPANAIDISDPEVLAKFRKQGYPLTDEVVKMLDAYPLPKVDNFDSVPTGTTYEEKRSNFMKLVRSLQPGLTEIIFHPSVLTDNLKTITGSWQQRVWEAQLFSDPVIKQFLKEEGIVVTNWKEVMKMYDRINP